MDVNRRRELEKVWNLQGWLIKKPHSLRSPLLAMVFSKGVTDFYEIALTMIFDFTRMSKPNPEISVEYLKRHFLNHPACFFFLEQTTDRQIDLCSGCWDTLPTSLPNNFFLNLSKRKYVTDYIQNIRLSPDS